MSIKWVLWYLLFVSVLVGGVIVFLPNIQDYLYSNQEIPESQPEVFNYVEEDSFPNIEGLHWTEMPITYMFENITECGSIQSSRVVSAFKYLENETLGAVSFKEDKIFGKIKVKCYPDYPVPEPGKIVMGEAQYWNDGNKISNAEIVFFNTGKDTYSGGCYPYPDTEIHEILHIFGYTHIEKRESIMNPSHNMCHPKMDDEIKKDLILKYSIN